MACPSGHDLLAFHQTELVRERRLIVEQHLDRCDFCCAELQMLESFPQGELSCSDEAADFPAPLRRLAEALIGGGERTLRAMFDYSPESDTVSVNNR